MRFLFAAATAVGVFLSAFGCSDDAVAPSASESDLEEAPGGVFNSTSVFAFKVDAPFAQLIARVRSGQADPPKPEDPPQADAGAPEPEFSEPGHVVVGDKTLD